MHIHVFYHVIDYIVLGVLIACMLGAAAMVISRRSAQRLRPKASSQAPR
jgi:ABC-type antimicrobial peptide transport system permease subunit